MEHVAFADTHFFEWIRLISLAIHLTNQLLLKENTRSMRHLAARNRFLDIKTNDISWYQPTIGDINMQAKSTATKHPTPAVSASNKLSEID